jgi:lysine N6-hydroxylase
LSGAGKTNYDLVGIGIGPSNLSLAALLEPFKGLRSCFFDRTREFKWHPGLLFREAEIQVSHLKDLVTLADPTSRFSFLSFLHDKKRLYRFIHAGFPRIRRSEFDQYLHWVASQLPNLHFSRPVDAVCWEDDGLVVRTGGEKIRTRHLALGSGLTPLLPAPVRPHLCDTVFHSSDYLLRNVKPGNRRVLVVGGGQSGAEVVAQLLADSTALPRELYWVTRRSNFHPMDESPFANELFTPTYSEYFFRLPQHIREKLVGEQKLASDGISANLLQNLCQRLYELDFLERSHCRYQLLPGRELCRVRQEGGDWCVEIQDMLSERCTEIRADYLIFCTGYSWVVPSYLEPLLDRIELDGGQFRVHEDYSISWQGAPEHRIYALNAARNARGVADPNLSLLAWRSSKIVNSLMGREVYSVDEAAVPVSWNEIGEKNLPAEQGRLLGNLVEDPPLRQPASRAGLR